jgi:hypothetical protein
MGMTRQTEHAFRDALRLQLQHSDKVLLVYVFRSVLMPTNMAILYLPIGYV